MAQCAETIAVRDTYRVSRTGRGAHFKLHHTEKRCSREAQEGSRYCWQHRPWHAIEEREG
jgi:hypothetical protein